MSDAPGFTDHFGNVAAAYAAFRPRYPAALLDAVARHAPATESLWDCACGSGQATMDLADRFAHVWATDASARQIASAPEHPRIRWHVAPAEASGLEPASVDCVTVAQALHWFDADAFAREVRRVARPGGLVVAWSYGALVLDDPAVDARYRHFHFDTLGPYWPAERRHVDGGYADVAFPFPRVPLGAFEMTAQWSLPTLAGYLRTWSAREAYLRQHGRDPVVPFLEEIAEAWGDPARVRTVRWPLAVLAGRV